MTRNPEIRLGRLERLAWPARDPRKPGGIDWAAILASAATSPPIHSPYWRTPEGQRVRGGSEGQDDRAEDDAELTERELSGGHVKEAARVRNAI